MAHNLHTRTEYRSLPARTCRGQHPDAGAETDQDPARAERVTLSEQRRCGEGQDREYDEAAGELTQKSVPFVGVSNAGAQ
jgi:hypothetical protein